MNDTMDDMWQRKIKLLEIVNESLPNVTCMRSVHNTLRVNL